MTDIEMLPLPECFSFMDWREQLQDYARANVAHHTAELQAEIEALRAEVEFRRELSAQHSREAVFWERKHAESEARAERLAEALRELSDYVQETAHHNAPAAAAARAMLREQEEGK